MVLSKRIGHLEIPHPEVHCLGIRHQSVSQVAQCSPSRRPKRISSYSNPIMPMNPMPVPSALLTMHVGTVSWEGGFMTSQSSGAYEVEVKFLKMPVGLVRVKAH